MKLKQFEKREWLYLLCAFAAPFLAMTLLMLVAGYTPFGNKSMLYSDMWHQYYPFFKAFREALRSGESLLYTWNIGMGIDYLGLISYYLASPLNLLTVIMPESWMQGYFGMLMPIKLGFAGLFFAIFLKKTFGKSDLSLPLFGWFYAMCAWALGYQWNVMWLDTFALLPLVVLGALSLLKERKFILYTVTLFLSIFANYYIGFFICIFVLLVCICYEICCCKSLLRLLSDVAMMALFSMLAIGMTAVLELPALAALQTTHSSVNAFPEGFSMNIVGYDLCKEAREAWQAYKTAKEAGDPTNSLWVAAMKASWDPIMEGMRQVAGNMAGGLEPTFKEGLPNLYCGVGTLFLAFMYLIAGDAKLREKLCCVVLLLFFMLSFLIRQLDYIWHGFHFTNMIPYRFSFLFSFVLLCMAYKAFLNRRKFEILQMIPAAMLTVCVLLCSDHYKEPIFLAYNGVFLLLYLGVYIFRRISFRLPPKEQPEARQDFFYYRKLRRTMATWILVGVMCLELVMNLVNFGVRFPYTAIPNYPKGTTYAASMIRYMKQDPDLFYRAEVTHAQTLNDSALNGYNGISTFTSSANVSVTNFLKSLGYAARDNYNRYCWENGSPVANLFLNLKYMIERDGKVIENSYFDEVHHYGDVYLLENNAYLPLGFLAERGLGTFVFSGSSQALAFQNQLFTAATGIDENVWQLSSGKTLDIRANGTNVTNSSSGGYCAYQNKESQTTLVYHYDFTEAGFFCVDMNMSARNSFTVWKNGVQLFSENLSLPQTMAVSDVAPGDNVEIHITCKANESGSITIQGGLLNDEVFRRGYDILAASTLELTEFSNTHIKGTIDCDRGGLMYTSIPQNGENWTATVDGEEAEIILVGDCMIALELTRGTHEIEFTYSNSSYTLGLLVSLASLVVFLGIIAEVYGQRWKDLLARLKK